MNETWLHSDPFFSKTRTKGHLPLNDHWTHVCWGHICDSTQGSLCPSPMGIHQYMWIQWSISQNDHIHILHTICTYYVLSTEWVITRSLTELSSGETKRVFRVYCTHTISTWNLTLSMKMQSWSMTYPKEKISKLFSLKENINLFCKIQKCETSQ